jgi:hypothetical protein
LDLFGGAMNEKAVFNLVVSVAEERSQCLMMLKRAVLEGDSEQIRNFASKLCGIVDYSANSERSSSSTSLIKHCERCNETDRSEG